MATATAERALERERRRSPTGLIVPDLERLSTGELAALERWMRRHAGEDGGRLWWPAAVRRLSLDLRLRLALDDDAAAAWRELERRKVTRSPVYFVRGYGHLQPPRGAPIPFAMWAEQEEVLVAFWHRRRVIVLKARQLGLTWLALHYAYWLQAFNEDTPNARILALSKHGGDASKLLERARKIRELLPPFLRHDEASDTRGSKSELELVGRGKMVSLAGTEEAARSETATLVLLDEFGFIRNGQAGGTLTATDSTIGDDGGEIILSTGNGRTGNGAALYEEWRKAKRGESERHAIFLPASTDPRRTDDWRDRRIGNYRSEEEFEAEHPETEHQAFAGAGTVHIYPPEHLDAAAAIGAELAKVDGGAFLDELLEAQGLGMGTDWGDLQTFTVWDTDLPGLGVLFYQELLQSETEPEAAGEAICGARPAGVRIVRSQADLSPPGTNRTFAKVLARHRQAEPARWPEQHVNVPFGKYKEGGQQRDGINTVGYLRNRLKAAHRFVQTPGWEARVTAAQGIMAILADRCPMLRAQMENLERDPNTGKVRKPDYDPRHPELGDHGPDACVAGSFHRATAWSATLPRDDEP